MTLGEKPIQFTYHRNQSNIHSRLERIYATKQLIILNSHILPFQHLDHKVLLTEFVLRVRIRGLGYWKVNTSILAHETSKAAIQKTYEKTGRTHAFHNHKKNKTKPNK